MPLLGHYEIIDRAAYVIELQDKLRRCGSSNPKRFPNRAVFNGNDAVIGRDVGLSYSVETANLDVRGACLGKFHLRYTYLMDVAITIGALTMPSLLPKSLGVNLTYVILTRLILVRLLPLLNNDRHAGMQKGY